VCALLFFITYLLHNVDSSSGPLKLPICRWEVGGNDIPGQCGSVCRHIMATQESQELLAAVNRVSDEIRDPDDAAALSFLNSFPLPSLLRYTSSCLE
jgi:hypothetical protein